MVGLGRLSVAQLLTALLFFALKFELSLLFHTLSLCNRRYYNSVLIFIDNRETVTIITADA